MIYRITLLGFALLVQAASAKEDLVFYVVDYPPYVIVNDKNEISGMDVDVVSAAFQESGETVIFKVLPWKRVMKLMQVGEIAGGLSCSKRKGRESYMLFSEYISLTRQAVITRKNFNTSKIKNIIDLNSYSVTTVSGWGTDDELKEHQIDFTASKDIRSGLVSVLHRGVNALYGPEIPTMHSAKKMGQQDQIKATYLDDVTENKLHLCISKTYPNSVEILTSFNKGLKTIKKNGRYKEIQSTYF